jgi:3alpha(or 20beta)-hydroxysteroid dehydrogenase
VSGRLEGVCVIVSGASRGQGAAEAQGVVREGGSVILGDVLEAEGRALAEEIGERAIFTPLDVRKVDEWARAVKLAEDNFGDVGGLVNNAGILERGRFDQITPDEFQKTQDINVMGTFLGIQAVWPSMARRGRGSIVNISSVGGMLGAGAACAYITSKWAVRGMAKAAASDLARYGIRANSIHPGPIATPMIMDDSFSEEQFINFNKYRMPMRRLGSPDEVAAAALFLLSDEASYITGAEITVDGGWLFT